VRGKKLDERVVGLAVDRSSSEPDLDALAMAACELGT
jgi:hypothetical protein